MANRRKNLYVQSEAEVDFGHAQVTANTTVDLYTVPAGRELVVDRVLYCNPTGLATSDTNYVVVNLLCNGNVAASWSTKTTGGTGAFVAGTQVAPAVSGTAVNINAAAGQKLQFQVVVTGAPTLPPGAIRAEFRLL